MQEGHARTHILIVVRGCFDYTRTNCKKVDTVVNPQVINFVFSNDDYYGHMRIRSVINSNSNSDSYS